MRREGCRIIVELILIPSLPLKKKKKKKLSKVPVANDPKKKKKRKNNLNDDPSDGKQFPQKLFGRQKVRRKTAGRIQRGSRADRSVWERFYGLSRLKGSTISSCWDCQFPYQARRPTAAVKSLGNKTLDRGGLNRESGSRNLPRQKGISMRRRKDIAKHRWNFLSRDPRLIMRDAASRINIKSPPPNERILNVSSLTRGIELIASVLRLFSPLPFKDGRRVLPWFQSWASFSSGSVRAVLQGGVSQWTFCNLARLDALDEEKSEFIGNSNVWKCDAKEASFCWLIFVNNLQAKRDNTTCTTGWRFT